MIDLHSHTTASDGSYSPAELVTEAVRIGLEALAITDHDTFDGYAQALPFARAAGLPLYQGIEISTALGNPKVKTIHLLGYFLKAGPTDSFTSWLAQNQAARRDRNERLVIRLQSMGLDIALPEVYEMGRSLAGRPHFARILVQKGYARSIPDAFEQFIGENAPGYVDKEEPSVQEGIRRVREAGGLASLAHPIRLGKRELKAEEAIIAELREAGLEGIEVFHSDQTAEDSKRYAALAMKYGLKVTGGSDFHGTNKPNIQLGSGLRHNLNISKTVLEALLR